MQEVVAVAACVERLHPEVRFVSEIGGEDMKTIFFTAAGAGKSKQVFMQSACSGGTGTFIEKTARKLQVASERLAAMPYAGLSLHKVSSKCGIFAETDANTLVKTGVPVEEIIASLFEAVVYQNLATLTKGNTPMPDGPPARRPQPLLQGAPGGVAPPPDEAVDAARHPRRPATRDPASLILVPEEALYYACLGCVETGPGRGRRGRRLPGARRSSPGGWTRASRSRRPRTGRRRWSRDGDELASFVARYGVRAPAAPACPRAGGGAPAPVLAGLRLRQHHRQGGRPLAGQGAPLQLLRHLQGQSHRGRPVALPPGARRPGSRSVGALALTGYGKDLLRDVLGADVAIVETVAHATAALHYVPDADVICDVGGTDVKIMLLRQGTVADFRLNSQCSSGNGAFLQGVAERYGIPLEGYAERAFAAKAMPSLAMGCGVFLQSDIVNQQRKGWAAEEIMAALAAVLPVNVWIYAGQLQNLRAAGRKFVLQGGTHRNMAVVKAQIDFITSKVPDAEVVRPPLLRGGRRDRRRALRRRLAGRRQAVALPGLRDHRGADLRQHDQARRPSASGAPSTARGPSSTCSCPARPGRAWSKVPLASGWERVISGNSCPKGLVEDANEMRTVKAKLEEVKRGYPNVAEMVRKDAFRRARTARRRALGSGSASRAS